MYLLHFLTGILTALLQFAASGIWHDIYPARHLFYVCLLKQRKIEVNQCKKERNAAGLKTWKCKSTRYLMGFIAGFGLTLIVHFYDTMVAGLFCIGIAGGYLLRIFKRSIFSGFLRLVF